MLALSELSKLWPVAGWILRVFDKVLRRLTGRGWCPIARLSDQATLRSGEGTWGIASNGLDSLPSPTPHSLRGLVGATDSQTVDSHEGIMPEDIWAQELDFDAFENIFQDSLTDAFAPYGTGLG